MIGSLRKLCIKFVIENNLSYAVAVAEVDKSHAAHLAYTLYPSGKSNLLAFIGEPEFAAGVCSEHILGIIKIS